MQKKYTKNIHIYPVNNKFNKNILSIEDEKYAIHSMASQSSIYKYLYTNEDLQDKNNIENNLFIINNSIINNEITDFITNFHNIFNIWIFIDNNSFVFDDNKLNIKYITSKHIENLQSKILPSNIVDKSIYSNNKYTDKVDQLIYFFSPYNMDINKKLQKYLYPASNLKIKLFDNNQFNHPQNLGYLSENDRGHMLRESKFYICDNNNYYTTEALLSGCIVINLDDSSSIEDQMKSNKTKIPEDFIYYIDFLGELCNEK